MNSRDNNFGSGTQAQEKVETGARNPARTVGRNSCEYKEASGASLYRPYIALPSSYHCVSCTATPAAAPIRCCMGGTTWYRV